MNAFVWNILNEAIASDVSFVSYLNRAKRISVTRGVYYGFEWLFHTAIASYLIDNEAHLSISNLSIGSLYGKTQRPDIKFSFRDNDILIELKTIEGNGFSWCKGDIRKLQNYTGYRYVAVCCYRKNADTTPNLHGAQYEDQFIINGAFRVVLLSIL